MSNPQSKKCENQEPKTNQLAKLIAPVVCQNSSVILRSDFIEWLDDQLFELELKFMDFQTRDSMSLKSTR